MASKALAECLIDNGRALDDGISDALTIAEAVLAACTQQQQTATELYGRHLSPQAKLLYLERTQEATRQRAVRAVLDSRRAQRKQL
jgi:hypothetical protein